MDSGACAAAVAATDEANCCKTQSEEIKSGWAKSEEDARAVDGTPSLCPITPDSTKESGENPFDVGSPLTSVKKLPKVLCFDLDKIRNGRGEDDGSGSGSPRTPNDCVFDPFAPGPDDMLLAPLCKKCFDRFRGSVARRLDFEDSPITTRDVKDADDHPESASDEQIFLSLYQTILEIILSEQAGTVGAGASGAESDDADAFRTPPSAPIATGTAHTCPPAPVKPSAKPRTIDLSLCRKLQF